MALSCPHSIVYALSSALTFLVALLSLCVAAEQQTTSEWPLFRGNTLQTGVAPSALPERLEILWQFKAKDSIEAAAAIAGGTVFIGAMDEHLVALDLATGGLKWSYKAGPFKAAAGVRDGAVYVGDLDGMFHCLDAATGKPRWTFKIEAEISSGANFSGTDVLFGGGDETLYCLTKDGKERWKFRVPGGPVLGSPAVVAGHTFAAGCDSTLHVLDAASGKELRSVDLGGQVGASAAVAGDLLYVGTMANQVLAVDWKKPEVAWTFEAEKRQQAFYASPALTDALVVIGSRDKYVHALDRKTGKEVWSFATKGKVDGSAVVAGGRVYVGSQDGNLYVLDLAKGTETKKFALGSAVNASPAVASGRLVIGTQDGIIYCLGAKNAG